MLRAGSDVQSRTGTGVEFQVATGPHGQKMAGAP